MSQELTDNPLGIWGLGVWGLSTCYKHIAPLERKIEFANLNDKLMNLQH